MTYRLRRFSQEDLATSVDLTDTAFGAGWFPVDWNWRYVQHPTPVDMWVIDVDDATIGFASAVERQLRLGPDLDVPSLAEGDLVIDPTARGLGYARNAIADLMRVAKEGHPDAVVVMAWARQELTDGIYGPIAGVARLPSAAIRYTYQRTWETTITRFATLSSLPSKPIRFEAPGMDSLTVGPRGLELDGPTDGASATVRLGIGARGLYRGSRLGRYWRAGLGLLKGQVRPVGLRSWVVLLLNGRAGVKALLTVLR